MSKVKLDWSDIQEIADKITEVENDDLDMHITETAIYNKFNVDFEDFSNIVNAIFQKIDFGLSPLTQEAYVGIADSGMWLAKKEVNQQFISGIINWCTEGEKISEKSKGFIKTITSNGKAEYDITITRPKIESAT